jgi:uncharacterized protein YciI
LQTLPPIKRTLFVERVDVVAPPSAFEAAARSGLAREELAYAKAMVEAGKLVLGGELASETDDATGGLWLLKASSLAEARELAAARPFARAGLVRSTVLEWQVRWESPL